MSVLTLSYISTVLNQSVFRIYKIYIMFYLNHPVFQYSLATLKKAISIYQKYLLLGYVHTGVVFERFQKLFLSL
jgi:hypothetical protein